MLAFLTDRQWLWLAADLYLAGFFVGTRSLLRQGRPSGIAMYSMIASGFILQLTGLYLRGRAVGSCPLGNAFEMLQFTAWSAILLYLVVGVAFRSSILGYFMSALAAALTVVSLSVPAWDATRQAHLFGNSPWIEFHAALALFSYGVFALLALTSVLLLFRLHSLESKQLGGWFQLLPSVLGLDQIGVRLLATGVVLLAASLGVGAVYWLRDPASVGVSKLLTVAVWLLAAAVLLLRLKGVLLAKNFAWSCVVLFAVALASLEPIGAGGKRVTDRGQVEQGRFLGSGAPQSQSARQTGARQARAQSRAMSSASPLGTSPAQPDPLFLR